jgi:hypothetical protein
MDPRPHTAASPPLPGIGLGLRPRHLADLESPDASVPWLEALADNYAHTTGPARRRLLALRERYPMALHGVGMSLGSTDPVDRTYLRAIADLAREVEPVQVSEHLAWTAVGGRHHHELLPLPFVTESVEAVARNVRVAQDVLGRRILLENSAAYLAFDASEMDEAAFVTAVLETADCDLLLDVNNLFVNARNHGFDPCVYLDAIPGDRVRQMHLGGHDDHGDVLIDAHGSAVVEPVWALFAEAVARFPDVPTSIEWDRDVPDFAVLEAERTRAEAVARAARPSPPRTCRAP